MQGPPVPGKKIKSNFPRHFSHLSHSQNLQVNHNSQLFVLSGRVVRVGETFNRSADFGL